MSASLLRTLGAVLGFVAIARATSSETRNNSSWFDWEGIKPSHKLEYHGCYHDFQCARLLLPLDWLNETDPRTVAIAITKLPAVVSDHDPSFGGTIFAQPGGPSAAGTTYIRNRRENLGDLFDIPGKKHYELLSFDPRGVGHSTPRIDCWPGVLGVLRSAEFSANGGPGLSPESLAFAVEGAKADYRQCEKVHGDFLSFVNTPSVARDMVAMIDRIDDLRKGNARELVGSAEEEVDEASRLELRSVSDAQSETGQGREDLPRLQYIGISYGTLLGNFFASMFPGRVGRMVLDGVCDPDDYVNGVGWLKDTVDTDEMAERFFQGCFEAGESTCALCRKTDSSPEDISNRFWSWVDTLDENPVIDILESGSRQSMRSGDIRALFLTALYNAVFVSQTIAVELDNAMQGNTTAVLKRIYEAYGAALPQDPHKACANDEANEVALPADAMAAILCGDGEDITGMNNSDWRDYLAQQRAVSSIAGAQWTNVRLACAGWRTRPNWSFKGPFETPEPSKLVDSPEPDRPAAPLFFVSNRWDPVTPVRNARDVARRHPGAGVMVHESTGHCVVLNAMGPCAREALARYFDTGEVPSEEITCEAARGPWDQS